LLIDSPVGELLLVATDAGLAGVYFDVSRLRPPPVATTGEGGADILAAARQQLDEYFTHRRVTFDLPLDLRGTPFQLRVWNALREVPYGETVSYSEIARRIGAADAVRAVGAANGANPIPIVVPCHRVVGARGELTGFGGGIERKRWLLAHETKALLDSK
jgi:methylated-DNA-[protein]-cysteine S-methyltransferase